MEKSAHNISDLPPGMPPGFTGDGSQRLPFGIEDMRAWSLRNQSAEAASSADFAGSRAETDYLGLSSTLLNGASRVGRNFYTIGSRGPLLP